MTVDIEKARALVEELRSVDISWSDDGEAAAEAADTIDALLDEVEHWKAESASWEKQASDRVDDALKFAAERDALMSLIRDEIDENARLRDLGGAAADENITAMIKRVIAERDALARDARELLAQMRYIRTHLYAATVQRSPSDDRIIADHVEQAYLRANEVIKSMEEACDKPSSAQTFGNDIWSGLVG